MMKNNDNNIFPVFNEIVQREEKEKLLKQKAQVIWLTGLSGSGKTTIARHLDQQLYNNGFVAQVLDGDNIRSGINNNLIFTEEDRYENIRRIAEVNKLFLNCGIITLNSFISPTEEIRNMAIDIVGKDNFIEIFVNTPIEVCEKRDIKGLYAKARRGEIKNFTGIDSPFEFPENADVEIRTDLQSIEESVKQALDFIMPRIAL